MPDDSDDQHRPWDVPVGQMSRGELERLIEHKVANVQQVLLSKVDAQIGKFLPRSDIVDLFNDTLMAVMRNIGMPISRTAATDPGPREELISKRLSWIDDQIEARKQRGQKESRWLAYCVATGTLLGSVGGLVTILGFLKIIK